LAAGIDGASPSSSSAKAEDPRFFLLRFDVAQSGVDPHLHIGGDTDGRVIGHARRDDDMFFDRDLADHADPLSMRVAPMGDVLIEPQYLRQGLK
jgi:hypothetical protein